MGAYLNIKRLHKVKNVITNITYLTNYVTVLLNKSLGKAPIRLTMASSASLLNSALSGTLAAMCWTVTPTLLQTA